MIDPKLMFEALKSSGIELFAGVPDSLLKNFCAYVDDNASHGEHIITANEGNAVALAAGYHMTTGKIAAVYMQNSGLGNTINPLTSITDAQVYKIPVLLIIGWRGEPGIKDEPQHVKQGDITQAQLDLLDIPYFVVDETSDVNELVNMATKSLNEKNSPVALLVRKGAFSGYKSRRKPTSESTLKREDALNALLELSGESLVVSTTGKTSREVFELRVKRGEVQRDFLTVGGMGHTSSIALGAALGNPGKKVICIDGDGSALMHLGALPIIGDVKPKNMIHVLLNNEAHESVGGQPTVGGRFDFKAVAKASGYNAYDVASTVAEVREAWHRLDSIDGPVMLEVKITTGSRDDLGRPTTTAEENKLAFMTYASKEF